MESSSWVEAEAWRRAGQWAKAGAYFHARLKDAPSAGSAWRYAYCLRKAGYSEAALQVAQSAAARWPDQQAVRWELVWCLYAARLQPAQKEEGAEERVLEAAREMVRAGAEGLALQLTVFAAAGAARRRGQWGEVLAWCGRLQPGELPLRPEQGRKLMPPRERWHLARVKALVNLEKWDEAMEAAREARADYPQSADFLRWQAACLAGKGDREGAAALLGEHLGARRKQWYVLADLARLRFELGDVEGAYGLAMEAVMLPGEDSAKVNLLMLLARLCSARVDFEAAGNWLGWCMQLRLDQGWPLRPVHQEILGELERAGVTFPARPAKEWRRLCLEGRARAEERKRGRIEGCDGVRPFCFVKDGAGRYFVLTRDVPEDCRRNGAEVEFTVIQGFDRKKGRPALQASRLSRARKAHDD